MLNPNFVFLGAAIGLLGTVAYTRDTIRGLTHPNRVTWFLWGAVPMLTFAVELQTRVGVRSVMALSIGLGPLIIFAASFLNRSSVWKIGTFDYLCGALSILGTAVWLVTSKGVVGIWASIAADTLAGIPTFVKSWKAPETETPVAFLSGFLNAVITVLTIKVWTTAQAAFPIYIVIVAGGEFTLTFFRIGPRLVQRWNRRREVLEHNADESNQTSSKS